MPDSSVPVLLDDDTSPEALVDILLAISLTGILLLRPLYAADETTIVDFAWVRLNPAAQQLLQLPARPSQSFLTLFPTAQATGVFDFYRDAFLSGQIARRQNNYQHDGLDGYYLLVAQRQGKLLAVSFTDTTEQLPRSAMEEELRQSQAREVVIRAEAERQRGELARLLAQAPVAMALFRGPNYVIELANESMATVWGRPLAQVLGQPVFEALPYVRNQGFEALFADVLTQGTPIDLHEVPVTIDRAHPDQPSQGYFNLTYRPQHDAQGRITGIITSAHEVTEQVLARQQVEQLNAELEARVQQRTQALRAQEEKYRLLFETIEQGYGIAEVRLATAAQPASVHWLEVNPAFVRLLKVPAAALRREQGACALGIDLEEAWLTHFVQVVRTGQAAQFEVLERRLEVWFDVYAFELPALGVPGELPRLGVLFRNSTARRQAQQQQQLAAVLEGQEEERRRIAESLHDGIGQVLYATKLQLDQLPPRPSEPGWAAAQALLGDAIRQTRAVSHELTPALLTDFGLPIALETICQQLHTAHLRWHCYLDLGAAAQLPIALQQAVYRLTQGLAHNVAQHAQATEATLEVTALPGWLVLRLEDNGRGFDPATVREGLGLKTLRSRVALLAGTVRLDAAPSQGTCVLVRLPVPLPCGRLSSGTPD